MGQMKSSCVVKRHHKSDVFEEHYQEKVVNY